jgi:hypothetical protein
MAKHTRILVAALIVAITLAVAVGTASARRLAASELFFLAHYSAITFEGGEVRVVCAFSMEGSFHSRTLEKVTRSLIGYITEVRIKRPCSGGESWALTSQEGRAETLPWHILYERFIGALPNITGIEISDDNIAFSMETVGILCLYQSSTTSPARGIVNREAGGKTTSMRASETAAVPKKEGSLFCPASAAFKGTGIVGTQVGYREITVTLVA